MRKGTRAPCLTQMETRRVADAFQLAITRVPVRSSSWSAETPVISATSGCGPAAAPGSTQNHLAAEVLSVTRIGNRVRLGLVGPQPLAAEITGVSADQLGLHAGARVIASWKASATRLVAI